MPTYAWAIVCVVSLLASVWALYQATKYYKSAELLVKVAHVQLEEAKITVEGAKLAVEAAKKLYDEK